MNLRIVLHAGTGKTGTTSLQNTLSSHREALRLKGLLYPDMSVQTSHLYLLPAILGDDIWPREFRDDNPDRRARALQSSERVWDALCEVARTAPSGAVLVISCEHIFALHDQSMTRLQQRLAALANEIVPIVYMRSPADHYLSSIQQRLKFDHRILSRYTSGFPESLRKMRRVFGVQPRVRVFAAAQLYNGCVVQDFLIHHAGFDPQELQGIEVQRSNTSISAEGMALIQMFNRAAFPDSVPFGNSLSKRVLGLIREEEALNTYTRPRLHPPIRRAIRDLNRDGLIWLQDNFGCEMSDASEAESEREDQVGDRVLDRIALVADLCSVDPARLEQMTQVVFPTGLQDWLTVMRARQEKHRARKAVF